MCLRRGDYSFNGLIHDVKDASLAKLSESASPELGYDS